MDRDFPPSLGEAIMTEPVWLLAWLGVLALTHLGALPFVLTRQRQGWRVRYQAIAIVLSFFIAAAIMEWMYGMVGYVRLLGLAHIAGWGPVYIYLLRIRKTIARSSWYGRYIHFYLVVVGISLCIDVIDVVRYVMGDGELFMRWAS